MKSAVILERKEYQNLLDEIKQLKAVIQEDKNNIIERLKYHIKEDFKAIQIYKTILPEKGDYIIKLIK